MRTKPVFHNSLSALAQDQSAPPPVSLAASTSTKESDDQAYLRRVLKASGHKDAAQLLKSPGVDLAQVRQLMEHAQGETPEDRLRSLLVDPEMGARLRTMTALSEASSSGQLAGSAGERFIFSRQGNQIGSNLEALAALLDLPVEELKSAIKGSAASGAYGNPLAPNSPVLEYYNRLSADYRTADKLKYLLNDDAYWTTIKERFAAPTEQQKIILAMARDPAMRAGLVKVSQAELDARSASIEAGLKAAKVSGKTSESAQVFDDLYIGGGPGDTILTSVAAKAGASRKILTIEESSRYMSTFTSLDEAGFINSSNYGPERERQVKNWGEPDSFHGLVELSHTSSLYVPPFRDLGGLGVIDRALTPYPILFRRSVVDVEDGDPGRKAFGPPTKDSQYPARYKVTLNTGETVYAERVVATTGLGDERIPKLDADSNALLEAELKKADPDVMHSRTFMGMVADPTNLAPLAPFLGQDVIVVGGGDGGYMTAKYLFRRALEGSYGYDVSAVGSPNTVSWVGMSADYIKNHVEYGRLWYADLWEHVGDKELLPFPSRLKKFEKLEDGRFRLILEDGTSVEGKKVIFATGSKSRLDKVLHNVAHQDGPLMKSDQVEKVYGRGRRTYGKGVTKNESGHFAVAARVKGQEVYLAQAAAADLIVPKNDPVANDAASIVYVHTRTAGLGKKLSHVPSLHPRVEVVPTRETLEAGAGARDFELKSPESKTARNLPALEDLVLDANLLSTLKRHLVFADTAKTARLTFSANAQGALALRVTGLTEESASLLKATIEDNADLVRQIATIVGPGHAKSHKLKLSLARGPDGALTLAHKSVE